jgi:hypothetical protein
MTMKIAIVGSRTINDYSALESVLSEAPEHWMDDPRFISGGADGVDTLAERYASRNNIPIDVIEPDWQDWSNGNPAIWRNTKIVEAADVVVALWDGKSNGTRDSIDKALDRGKPIYVEVI